MSNLTVIEKITVETILGMGGGYVLDFNDRTFQEFVKETISLNIYDSKYNFNGTSKAKHLRAFCVIESNYVVAKLLEGLFQYRMAKKRENPQLYECNADIEAEYLRIVERLKADSISENLETLNTDDKDLATLSKSIRDSIMNNNPEVAIDRLHTYTLKYMRSLCDKHAIQHDKDKPLHSLFGEYVKQLKNHNIIESKMSEMILKSSISIIEAFNKVRNDNSLAHGNPLLSKDEAMLIFKNITNTLEFIDAIENRKEQDKNDTSVSIENMELPF